MKKHNLTLIAMCKPKSKQYQGR